jgi:hypothetical protein
MIIHNDALALWGAYPMKCFLYRREHRTPEEKLGRTADRAKVLALPPEEQSACRWCEIDVLGWIAGRKEDS